MSQMNVSWIESLKARGFSGLSSVMTIFSFAAAGIVILAAATILGGALMLQKTEAFHQTYGSEKTNIAINATGTIVKWQGTGDPACIAEVKKNGGKDVSKCPLIQTQPTPADIAAAKKDATSFRSKVYFLLPTFIYLIPVLVLTFGLLQAGLCFMELAKGRHFAPATIRHLRNFAFAGLFFVVVSACVPLIYTLLANLIFSIDLHIFTPKPIKHFTMPAPYMPPSFAIGSRTNFAAFLIGIYAFTLAIIAALMTKASAIAEDNAQII